MVPSTPVRDSGIQPHTTPAQTLGEESKLYFLPVTQQIYVVITQVSARTDQTFA